MNIEFNNQILFFIFEILRSFWEIDHWT